MIKIYTPKNIFLFFAVALMAAAFFTGCKKSNIDVPFVTPPDLTTLVRSSVSGFVTDENNSAVNLATVQVGTATTTTDKYGYFEIKNADVVKNAAVVSISKAGYFKGIKTYIATEGRSAFFRIKLIPKTVAGTVSGNSGGTVTMSNGLSINLPANAVMNATTNAAYTGTVNIAAHWLDPTAADLSSIMPGDLRGINTLGNMQLLTTYGMVAVELTGSGGELLQIATGKKANLTLPIPASILSSAPATIPLWHFDEAKGLWQQEGSATKNGNSYVGDVSHFSFWNWDVPGNMVQFNCTLKDQNAQPIPYILVRISLISNPLTNGHGYTDHSGYVSGPVPANAQLKLEVFPDHTCTGTPLYTQTLTTTTTNISLGTIVINNPAYILNVSGTATNCSNLPLSSGVVVLRSGTKNYSSPVVNGAYNFNLPVCSTPASVSITIIDVSNQQSSLPMGYTLNAGNNTISNIQACGTMPAEYTYYTIDGTPYYQGSPGFYFRHAGVGAPYNMDVYSTGYDPAIIIPHSGFTIVRPAVLPPASSLLNSFNGPNNLSGIPFPTPITVNYTEYGNIGQYIAGNFAGTIKNNTTNISYNITCSFRMKRTF